MGRPKVALSYHVSISDRIPSCFLGISLVFAPPARFLDGLTLVCAVFRFFDVSLVLAAVVAVLVVAVLAVSAFVAFVGVAVTPLPLS